MMNLATACEQRPRSTPPNQCHILSNDAAQVSPALLEVPSSTRSKAGSLFLDMLSKEIRIEVYKYLLVNPILGQWEVGHYVMENWSCDPVEYDLCISLLFTCLQIYAETSEVLYGNNTFFLRCFPMAHQLNDRNDMFHRHPPSPLTRYVSSYFAKPYLPPAAIKVRHWKLLMSAYIDPYDSKCSPFLELVEFCKLRSNSPPLSIELLVIPRVVEGLLLPSSTGGTYHDMRQVLRPLALMRNMPAGSIHIRDATLDKTNPSFVQMLSPLRPITSQLPDSTWWNALGDMSQSNQPVELASEIFPSLVRYAQSSERSEDFRLEMESGYLRDVDWEHVSPRTRRYLRLGHSNPFHGHPVERNLADAKATCPTEDISEFKTLRTAVLNYLEPQYQRIVAASNNLIEFIKSQKRPGFLLDPLFRETDEMEEDVACEALILLEKFAASFVRDLPLSVQIQIKMQQRVFDEHYQHSDRELTMAAMPRVLELRNGYYFAQLFRTAFQNMEEQYLEIRQARKALLEFDKCNQPGIDIDLELSRCDDKVRFDITEPYMDLWPEP